MTTTPTKLAKMPVPAGATEVCEWDDDRFPPRPNRASVFPRDAVGHRSLR